MTQAFRTLSVSTKAGAILAAALFAAALPGAMPAAQAASPEVVISQVYGGGGNTGAPYTHDFIEVFNRGTSPVSVSGWSLQYASATGTGNFAANSAQITELPDVTLAPGQYVLVQEAAGAGSGGPLPTPDVVDATPISMSASAGKVALVNTTTGLGCNGGSTPCSPAALATIVDLVGYGNANFFEGSGPAPATSNSTSASREAGGCQDTDDNAADFSTGPPNPRNSAVPASPCPFTPVTVDCGDPLVTEEGTAATGEVTASDADARVVDIRVTDVSPPPAPGTITVTAFTPAASPGDTAGAEVTVDELTPAGTYSVVVAATNDGEAPQTGTCSLTVTVTPPPVAIGEIQGDGHRSPLEGTRQTTSGVVTVVVSNGFFLQDPEGDGDPATSDGIFVFTGTATARTVAPGDEVTVTGTVTEFRPSSRPRDLTLTELTSVTIVHTGAGAPLPDPVLIDKRPETVISPDGIDEFEALEGMLVEIPEPTVVGPTNTFGEFVVVSAGNAGSTTPAGNLLVSPLNGDAVDYNPERIMVDDEARLPGGSGGGTRINDPQAQVRVGERATGGIVGVLDYQFSNYRVQANHVVADLFTDTTPDSPIGDLRDAERYEGRIASFNVENLFDCVDAPGKDDRTSCSAAALAALEVQLAKLAAAFEQELRSPEIVIIEETENTEVLTGDADGFVPGTSVPALLPRLEGNWDAVSHDASDVRGIEVGFVFDTDRVTLHDALLATDVLPDSAGVFDGSAVRAGREPLVGFFTLDDIEVILVGNHFKSKGGPQFTGDPDDAGDDPLYGAFQPPTRWTEGVRHQQADYVRELVDLLLAEHPGANLAVGGDLNDFWFPEPGEGLDTVARITTSATDPLTNVVDRVPTESRYTFVFEGNSQVLDHLLVNDPLAALLRDQGIGHFNAGFPVAFGNDPTVTFRSSDHDPLVAYFCTDATPPDLEVGLSTETLWPPDHRHRTVTASVSATDNADPGPTVSLVSVTSNEPDNAPGTGDGNTTGDIVIVDESTFDLRAERAAQGSGRIYTVTYEATDACGNTAVGTATVTVPLNQSR